MLEKMIVIVLNPILLGHKRSVYRIRRIYSQIKKHRSDFLETLKNLFF